MATFDVFAGALGRALSPLAGAVQSDDAIHLLVEQLGWTLPTVPPSLSDLGNAFPPLYTSLAALSLAEAAAEATAGDSSGADDALADVARDVAALVVQLHGLPDRLRAELPADFVAATKIDDELERRVVDWLLSYDISQNAPLVYRLLCVAGVIDVVHEPADPARFQPEFDHYTIRWDRLLQIIDPAALARDVYGWGTPALDIERLFQALVPLSFTVGMPAELRSASPEFVARTAPAAAPGADPMPSSGCRSSAPTSSRSSSSRRRSRKRQRTNCRDSSSLSYRRPAAPRRFRSATASNWM